MMTLDLWTNTFLKMKCLYIISQLKDLPQIAIVLVGKGYDGKYDYLKKEFKINVHVYDYPENTTEFEFDDEVAHLKEFYDFVLLEQPFPPHIRQEVAMAAIGDYWVENIDVDYYKQHCENPASEEELLELEQYNLLYNIVRRKYNAEKYLDSRC